MGISIPTALVAGYAIYCEYRAQQLEKGAKDGSILFLKTISLPYRVLVYVLNTGFALYNYMTGFDDYLMAGVLILSMNLVVNISKIVITPTEVTIGNTKMKQEDFQMVELKKLDEKNARFTFAMTIRKRRMEKNLYLPLSQMEDLNLAMKKLKGNKSNSSGKK